MFLIRNYVFLYETFVFNDEALGGRNGFLNKQNCCIWSDEQPQVIQELTKSTEKKSLFCGLRANDIIGSCFFKGDRDIEQLK